MSVRQNIGIRKSIIRNTDQFFRIDQTFFFQNHRRKFGLFRISYNTSYTWNCFDGFPVRFRITASNPNLRTWEFFNRVSNCISIFRICFVGYRTRIDDNNFGMFFRFCGTITVFRKRSEQAVRLEKIKTTSKRIE